MHIISRSLFCGIKCLKGNCITVANRQLLPNIKLYQHSKNYSVLNKMHTVLSNSKALTQCRWMGTVLIIKHDDSRFFIETRDGVAQLKYAINDGVMEIKHTGVPREMGGHGIGKLLAKAALNYGVEHGLIIKVTCSFVMNYVKEYEPHYLKYMMH